MNKKTLFVLFFLTLTASAEETLPGKPSLAKIQNQTEKLSGYDGFALFCDKKEIYGVLAVNRNGKYTIKTAKIEGRNCETSPSLPFILEPLHD